MVSCTLRLFVALLFCIPISSFSQKAPKAVTSAAVATQYRILAHHRYADSHKAAVALHKSLSAFTRTPNPTTHEAAKKAWLHAHKVYSHTEVFRFGNPNVDAWEGKVNAWPLDEGFIDYVSEGYVAHVGNPHGKENLIARRDIYIDDETIEEFQSGTDPKAGDSERMTDVETNVAIGFHAIEFLLWGQDLNQAPGDAGKRSHTDYLIGEDCTNGNCKRRSAYLMAAGRTLARHLQQMMFDWDLGARRLYAKDFAALPVKEQLNRMIVGMGSLSFGELAGERMQVALLAADQEEEQNCFSDSTHQAIQHNALGIHTLYLGRHDMADGKRIEGPSLSTLVAQIDPELDATLRKQFQATDEAAAEIVDMAVKGLPFDEMIKPEQAEALKAMNKLIQCLQVQTESLESLQDRLGELAAQ